MENHVKPLCELDTQITPQRQKWRQKNWQRWICCLRYNKVHVFRTHMDLLLLIKKRVNAQKHDGWLSKSVVCVPITTSSIWINGELVE